MAEIFEEGKRYVFDYERYKNRVAPCSWAQDCIGKEVDVVDESVGMIGNSIILPQWCKEIKG